jgi:hypothetical protein
VIFRSGIRWLREDGQPCRAGEVVAFCSVGLTPSDPGRREPRPFDDESNSVQVALATPIAGRLKQAPDSSRGGFFDLLESFQLWSPDYVVGDIVPDPGQPAPPAGETLRLLTMNARRPSGLAEGRIGILSGWMDRARASRIEGPGPVSTLLSVGICEMVGVLRGERYAFLEMLDAISGPAQIVYTSDDALSHTARVVIDQMRRTDADREAIARDLAETLPRGDVPPAPRDWIFAGALLNALNRAPVGERYEVLARDGVRSAEPARAILMSINAEAHTVLRHRKLGYTIHIHNFRLAGAGAAFNAWIRAQFEPVRKSVDDLKADYEELIDLIRARTPGAVILIGNAMSSSGDDDLQSYAAFDAPLGDTLADVRCKETNLMLCDLAREKDIAIVDIDAIAAELGGQRSMPDGVHQNGAMQAEMRAEILRILRARGVPGFGPPTA